MAWHSLVQEVHRGWCTVHTVHLESKIYSVTVLSLFFVRTTVRISMTTDSISIRISMSVTTPTGADEDGICTILAPAIAAIIIEGD